MGVFPHRCAYRALRRVTAGMLWLCWLGGCGSPETPIDRLGGQHLIWLFPGVEGGTWSMNEVARAIDDAGIVADIRIHDWERPLGVIRNLTALERNRRSAQTIADWIVYYHRQHPDAPIDLVGYSGGGGMALMTVEALPPDIRVRNVVLVHPAVSPAYDLTPALRRLDGLLVNFWSELDVVMLGVGTTVFGTMDRRHGASAGMRGFDSDAAVSDPRLRSRLVQRKWTWKAAHAGHIGLHLCILLYEWNREYVVPYLTPPPAARRG